MAGSDGDLSLPTRGSERPTNSTPSETAGANVSAGLQLLWQRLRDNPNPHILDCGPILASTVNVLAERGSRLYFADLISLARRGEKELWDRSGETPVFRTERLLSEFPRIPPGSVSAIFCWQLLDLLPRRALTQLITRLYLYLERNGVLFFILREPYLTTGADTTWCLESLTRLAARITGQERFPYPPLSNREMERLIPAGIAKIVLTRAGLREVLAVK